MAKYYRRECIVCGNSFITRSTRRNICSDECRKIRRTRDWRTDGAEQPCWTCTHACGGCSWSKNLTPIKGWDAVKVEIKEDDGYVLRTYRIKLCPQYEYGLYTFK